TQVSVLLDEARLEIIKQAQQVMRDEDLSVATGAGADTDRGNLDGRRDLLGHFHRHAFDDQSESPGLFGCQGVLENLGFISLDSEATHAANRLRRQADMTHNGDVSGSNGGDGRGAADTAFKLDRM